METNNVRGRRRIVPSLETFLRGMETHQLQEKHVNESPLKPSLEGWKHEPIPGEFVCCSFLETFLRGMETVLLSLCGVLLYHLETFLRGMETRHDDSCRVESIYLETFLRGMET